MASVLWSFILPSVQRLEVNLGQRLYCQFNDQQIMVPQLQRREWDCFLNAIKNIQQLPLFMELKLTKSPFATEDELIALLQKTPNITHLEVSWYPITDRFLQAVSKMCPLLERINISFCKEITDEGVEALLKLRLLKHIAVAGCTQIAGEALTKPKSGLPLQHLNLNHLPKLSNEIATKMLGVHRQLKELLIASCKKMTPEFFGLEQFPPLEILNLSAWNITDEELSLIAEKTPNLTFLNLNQSRGYCWKGLASALARWNKLQHLEYVCAKLSREDPDAELMLQYPQIKLISSLSVGLPQGDPE